MEKIDMARKKYNKRSRRKRRIWRQRIDYAILSILVLFVLVGSIYCRTVEVNSEKAAETLKVQNEQNQVAKQGEDIQDTSNSKADSVPEVEKETGEEIPEEVRSDFAVNPDIPCGSYSENDEKIVYLTFDDGPSDQTQKVLDILDKYKIKATFFVTNTCSDYAGMIKVAYDKGHTIGLHTSGHDYNEIYSSQEAYFADLDAIAQTVQEQIGYIPCFIRFPGGTSNTIVTSISPGLMQELIREVRARGYQYYDWNWGCGDGGVHTAAELTEQAIQCVDNNIVLLCHDSANKQTTVEALPKIIEHYQKQGYQFKAIDRDSYVAHHLEEESF